jgi:hypothetical protein
MTETTQVSEEHVHHHVIRYTVDGVLQETRKSELTVREILVHAGLDPANHYLVELRGSHQIDYKNLDEEIHIHEKEEFISVFTGPTPLS